MSAQEILDAQRAAADGMRRDVEQAVLRLAVDAYGATRSEIPIEGYRLLTRTELDDPLAGVRAALRVQTCATSRVAEWARKARAAGQSWDRIGEAFGVGPDDDPARAGQQVSRAAAAFEHVALGHALPVPDDDRPWTRFDPVNEHWTCGSCGRRITDRGPYESHPDDHESGHADSCERHHADVVAWRECAGRDDDCWDDE